jgi:hypothetical protein
MTPAPDQVYITTDSLEVYLVLRELFRKNPCAVRFGAETLSRLLFAERYLARRPAVFEIEAVLEALRDEDGEVLL